MSTPQPDRNNFLQFQAHENLTIIQDHDFENNKVTIYHKGNFLGKGGFARCYQLISQQTKQIFAVKIIQKSSLTKAKSKQKVIQQINIIFIVNELDQNPLITRSLQHRKIQTSFLRQSKCIHCPINMQQQSKYSILLQTLNDLIKRKRRLTQNQIRFFMLQVLDALEYLHYRKIIHRDLKLGNLFLNQNMHIKMGDFGLATRIAFPGEKRRTICGTPNYIAPEILQSKGHSYQVDVWSFGVIMYTLLYGRPPFESKDVKQTYKKIKSCIFTFPDTIFSSQSFKDLVISTLQRDPSKRPTIKQLKSFEFFQETTLVRQPSICFKTQSSFSATKQRQQRQLSDNGKLYTNNDLATSKDTFQKSQDRFLGTQRGSSHKRSNTRTDLSRVKSHRVFKQQASQRSSVEKTHYNNIQFGDRALMQCQQQNNKFNFQNTPTKNTRGFVQNNPLKNYQNSNTKVQQKPVEYVSVKKWIDYSSKYGIGYILSNNSYGVFFNDSTKILSQKQDQFYYIEKMQRQQIYKKYSFKDYPSDLKKKVSLFIHFKGYLSNQNENTNPTASGLQSNSKMNSTRKRTQKTTPSNKNQNFNGDRLIYVRRWFRSKHAVIFRLSNKSVQVIFVDQSQLLISSLKKQVIYINKKKQKLQYGLSQIMSCENKQLIKRFQYTKDVLNEMVSNHDKK